MEAALPVLSPGVFPTGLEKDSDLTLGAKLYRRPASHQLIDRGGNGPSPPCPVRWCASARGQGQYRAIPRPRLKALDRQAPGAVVFSLWRSRETFAGPLLASSGFTAVKSQCLEGLSGPLLKPGGFVRPAGNYRSTVLLSTSLCQLRS